MIRAIRFRIYPTSDQKKYLAGLFGAVRFCYNKALYLNLKVVERPHETLLGVGLLN